ncbi:MAG TPA: hypothetical protein EYH30_08915 [Anaerolineales bacterium]|nr:hypothetical protein [Anaerolineae bacterium]HIQ02231.1 hypothetical protein [Anaerolineales bacterium]
MSRYSPDAYRQLFPPYRAGGGPLRPGENGDHYRAEPHFFEWWYFDVAFPDGGWLVAIFHSAPFNVGDHRPTLDLRYYSPDGSPIVAIGRFARREYQAERDPFRVRVGPSWAAEEGEVYRLHLRQGPLAADLTFLPQLSGWRVGSGHLFAEPATGHHFDWVVPVPHARVEGWLEVGGEGRPVAGVGYHDHNWGNLYLPTAFRGWRWGRVWGGVWTLVFGDLTGRGDAARVTPLLLGGEGQVRELPEGFRLRDTGPGSDHLILEAAGGTDLSLSLALAGPMEVTRFAALRLWLVPWRRQAESLFYLAQPVPGLGRVVGAFLGTGTYRRWPARGALRIAAEEVQVQGVVEEMAFGSGGRGR